MLEKCYKYPIRNYQDEEQRFGFRRNLIHLPPIFQNKKVARLPADNFTVYYVLITELLHHPHCLTRLVNDIHGAFDFARLMRRRDRGSQARHAFLHRG